jgi:hypothetical protein
VVISDDETIKKVDSIWDKLNLGPLISSPSDYYKVLVPFQGATFKKYKTD